MFLFLLKLHFGEKPLSLYIAEYLVQARFLNSSTKNACFSKERAWSLKCVCLAYESFLKLTSYLEILNEICIYGTSS